MNIWNVYFYLVLLPEALSTSNNSLRLTVAYDEE